MNLFITLSTFLVFLQLTSCFRNHIDIDDFLNSDYRLFPNHTVQLIANLEEEALERFKSLLDNDDVLQNAYDSFKRIFGEKKDFTSTTDGLIHRRTVFKENLVYIFEHNLFARTKLRSQFEMGINKFVDMHMEEFKMERLGLDIPKHEDPPAASHHPHHNQSVIPKSLPTYHDWRDHDNIITPVRDQEKCGACVMFAITAALEGHHGLCKRSPADLSEQFIVDCATRQNGYRQNKGCDGNTFPDTLKFAFDHGITSEHLYPYTGKQGKCTFDGMHPLTEIKKFWRIPDNSADLKSSIVEDGPASIGIWVFKQFMYYKSGVYDACGHPSTAVGGHAMAITGFSDQGKSPYWILKNQWGTDWGEKGFVRYTSMDPRCGIEKLAYNYVVDNC